MSRLAGHFAFLPRMNRPSSERAAIWRFPPGRDWRPFGLAFSACTRRRTARSSSLLRRSTLSSARPGWPVSSSAITAMMLSFAGTATACSSMATYARRRAMGKSPPSPSSRFAVRVNSSVHPRSAECRKRSANEIVIFSVRSRSAVSIPGEENFILAKNLPLDGTRPGSSLVSMDGL